MIYSEVRCVLWNAQARIRQNQSCRRIQIVHHSLLLRGTIPASTAPLA
jgi:hypothetical protein